MYTPAGAEQNLLLGNGVTTATQYNTRLQPCRATASSPVLPPNPTSSNLLDRQSFYGNFQFAPVLSSPCGSETNNNGNIWAIVDNLNMSWNQGFTYDSLNRLTSANRSDSSTGSGYNHTYNYDSFGNMIVQDNLHGNPVYDIDPATNQLLLNPIVGTDAYGHPNNAFTYDYAGNMVSSGINNIGAHQYTYNALSQLTTVDGGNSASYDYNGLDERAFKQTSSGWTDYIYLNGQPMSEHSDTGLWTDYIYANGKKIAKLDSQKSILHFRGTRSNNFLCGIQGSVAGVPTGILGYQIQPGDQFVMNVKQSEASWAGLALIWNGAGTNGDGADVAVVDKTTGEHMWTTGISDGLWHAYVGDLGTLYQGSVVGDVTVQMGQWSPDGTMDLEMADAGILTAKGQFLPILNGNQSVPGISGSNCAGSNFSVNSESTPLSSPDAIVSTRYYLDDHLGTAQMELSAGGWPLWQGQFTPFGAELPDGQTAMHYKFTGKERDNESGLDYFGARYYAGNMGRFMSPDWSKSPEGVPYASLEDPQSLNLYAYVLNNPLSHRDPDGHSCAPDTMTTGKDGSTTVTAGACTPDWWRFQGARRWLGQHPKTVKTTGYVVMGATAISGVFDGGASELALPEELALEESLLAVSEDGAEVAIDLSTKPVAEGPELQRILDEVYKPGDSIPGGTAGAARQELATGENVGGAGKGHFLKAIQRARQLEKGLADGTFKGKDAQIARAVMNNLRDAVTKH